MKSIIYFVLTIMVLVAVALNTDDAGQKSTEQGKSNNEQVSVQVTNSMSSTLTSGLEKVLASLDELGTVVEDTGTKEKRIEVANKLGEDWDQIEKQVEENYPEDYENIEKSLYPLLAEAKKENPNLVSIVHLVDATTKKVTSFKESVAKTSS